jgi:hypothetical protein
MRPRFLLENIRTRAAVVSEREKERKTFDAKVMDHKLAKRHRWFKIFQWGSPPI